MIILKATKPEFHPLLEDKFLEKRQEEIDLLQLF